MIRTKLLAYRPNTGAILRSPTCRIVGRPTRLLVASRLSSSFTSFRWYSSDPTARYKKQLEQRAREEGVKSVDELKEKLKDELERHKKEFDKIDPLQALEKERESHPNAEAVAAENRRLDQKPPSSLPKSDIKSLDKFVDVKKLAEHDDPKEIEMIWNARFANKERALCGSLNGITFSHIYRNARKNPIFVLPLPHENQGIELHYIQWSFAGPSTLHCMMTTLAEYKLHQDFAKPHTTLIFHSDLMADKNLVLMNGTVEKDSATTLDEAILLSLNVQRFYSAPSGTPKQGLLEAFNAGSADFSVDGLVAEAEKLE